MRMLGARGDVDREGGGMLEELLKEGRARLSRSSVRYGRPSVRHGCRSAH